MVGMQASLHTSMRDIETDLTMKNETEPFSTANDILNDDIDDDDDILNDEDEFGGSDSQEDLRSPLSSDSNQQMNMNASLDYAGELGVGGAEHARAASGASATTTNTTDGSGELALPTVSYDHKNANSAEQERAQALKQQSVYSRQTVQSSTSTTPVKSAAPNVSPFDRR
jgi:hypothetical protein